MRLSRLSVLLMVSAALPLAACGSPDQEKSAVPGQQASASSAAPGVFTREQIENGLPAATPAPAPASQPAGQTPATGQSQTPPDASTFAGREIPVGD